MTDNSARTIGGLTPRGAQTDLSRLQRRNRTAPASSPTSTSPEPQPAPSNAAPPSPQGTESAAATAKGQDRITIYLNGDLRARARTAYRATAHLEDDRTWSDFIERAIRTEVERREATYNAGRTYEKTNERLAPGRVIS